MEGGATRRNWATPVAGSAGEGVEKEEGLTRCGFVAAEGGGAPVVGRPAAPREPGRGAPCSGGLPVWVGARAAWGGCGGRVELRGSTGLRQNKPEEGVLGSGRTDRLPACSGRARAGRCMAFIGGRGDGTRRLNSPARRRPR
jgi:hypothetical protein